jgi:hypothetical protein
MRAGCRKTVPQRYIDTVREEYLVMQKGESYNKKYKCEDHHFLKRKEHVKYEK